MAVSTAGERFRRALVQERPLQIVGAINAYAALMAEQVGFRCLYLSGGGVAAASYGLPDLGITSMQDVITDARRITGATDTPLLVDIDTGWGGAFGIARTIREMEKAGVGAIHIEDQVSQKRCGHRPNKAIVSAEEMCDRIKAAVDARIDPSFILMARTDALAVDGFNAVLDRTQEYVEAGADAIFAEAMTDVSMYGEIVGSVDVPVLANLTEFGATPLYSVDELRQVGVHMVLYPLSAFRAMNLAALNVYKEIRVKGTQRDVVATMQTRDQLYEFLGYHAFEQKLDELFREESDDGR
ncbi:MAG TPA: methylisocitrate lyase [Pseudomonadales bacterium]|jgi:methylisocitrate lyase|nr:methylisocitrate lyase [Gammaproteobacteria bacterium]HIM34192.1 methylisocitrate lyase [Pseudomonadales bacterium]